MTYEPPQGYANRPWDYEGELYLHSQMQAAYQAGRDSMKYEGELPEPSIKAGDELGEFAMCEHHYSESQVRQAIAVAKVGQSEPVMLEVLQDLEHVYQAGGKPDFIGATIAKLKAAIATPAAKPCKPLELSDHTKQANAALREASKNGTDIARKCIETYAAANKKAGTV